MTPESLVEIFNDLAETDDNSKIIDKNFKYTEAPFFDSFFVLSLIAFIDDQCGIVLSGQEISDSSTIVNLAKLIQSKVQ